jgi:aryl-alcohol dehydrogenase-like predicted oxidoreductase
VGLTRRQVLGGAAAAGAGLALPRLAAGEDPAATPLPRRAFGKTGFSSTVFGLGCFHVGAVGSDEEGASVVRRALDLGCNYLDTAPSYVRGTSERRVGIALRGRRDAAFLATKTLERSGAAARRDLEGSLRRLRVDYVDLLQVHCVRDAADLDAVLGEGGPLPALVEARTKGLVRFIGVTVHTDPAVAKAALDRWAWDSILIPLNPADPHRLSFVDGALPHAISRGVARVAMKVFGAGRLVTGKQPLPAEDCLRYAYGLDVSTAIVGCASIAEVDLAARVASEQKALSDAERNALVARAAPFSGGAVEWWKRA